MVCMRRLTSSSRLMSAATTWIAALLISAALNILLCCFGARVSACQDKVFRTFAYQPFGHAVPQHSQTTGDKIGGVPAHPRQLCRQFCKGLLDEPWDMALPAGGDGNLGLTIRVEQLRRQQIYVRHPVTIQLQIDQSSPDARILDRNGSSQTP